eukprot:CAMPEP_0113587430 /NCGR_PEP_ID=MMETSP0015_2-20120614/34898_1 /TAXON_ID=2838 /ORGANISM="Odontella" /LENGTH=90 /DNA_ID=CAMNT_0000493077 /DNA_START=72 /DNA_END=339 /DNA_ORIENTATION=+ /assembly_acc=CAM_ASM_000160
MRIGPPAEVDEEDPPPPEGAQPYSVDPARTTTSGGGDVPPAAPAASASFARTNKSEKLVRVRCQYMTEAVPLQNYPSATVATTAPIVHFP